MIYFIHAPALDAVKIGVTNDPRKRLALLKTGCPCELKLLATEEGDAAKEKELHRRFAEFRTRREWFAYGKPIADYVATLNPIPDKKRERWLTDLAERCGISKGYASSLVSGNRPVSFEAIVHVFNTVGWRHPSLDGIPTEILLVLGSRFPFRSRQAA